MLNFKDRAGLYFIILVLMFIIALLLEVKSSDELYHSAIEIKHRDVVQHNAVRHQWHVDRIADLEKNLLLFSGGKSITLTAYNNVPWQTDDTPDITASGARIKSGQMALSRDHVVVYKKGGQIEWGDTVMVILPLIVEDTMNKRYTDWGDIYMPNISEAIRFGRKDAILCIR